MNKKILICLLALFLFGCQSSKETDVQRFKKEYEQYNGQTDDNGIAYFDVSVNEDSKVKYIEKDKLIEVMSNGTHVVYFGWPSCPYCRLCIPVLLETINEYSGISMYYYNIKDMRDSYPADSDDTKLYKQLCDLILNSDVDISNFPVFEDGTIKLPASTFYFIKDGEIIGYHRGTVESHLNVYEPLEETQIEELKNIYRSFLDEMIKKDPIGCSEC